MYDHILENILSVLDIAVILHNIGSQAVEMIPVKNLYEFIQIFSGADIWKLVSIG